MIMKGYVDKELCIGCGLCAAIYPEVFTMDEDGKAVAIDKELDASQCKDAKDTAKQCPVDAISVK